MIKKDILTPRLWGNWLREFGSVKLDRAFNSSDLRRLLTDPVLKSEAFIVKPSWYSPHTANFTDAETLRMLLEALDGRVLVTESYSFDRQDGSMRFNIDGDEVDWRWVMRHPNWDWAREKSRRGQFRKQDKWFLDEQGFTDLFQETGVEYVNVTEDVWAGKVMNAAEVKEAVEAKFSPVFRAELYGCVPRRFAEFRDATLVSLGRVKGIRGVFPSLTMKNLFGLIPDPLRSWWHGPDDGWLGRSIVDIIKVYSALFNVYGICEAIRNATISDACGPIKVPWGAYAVVEGLGVIALGPHLVSLDAILCSLIGVDPEKVSYIQLGEEAFGSYDRRIAEQARGESRAWFPI